MTAPEIEAIIGLSAQHVTGQTVEDDGELMFWVEDGESAVELTHEIGDPEVAAQALLRLADKLREHAERIQYRRGTRSAGWT